MLLLLLAFGLATVMVLGLHYFLPCRSFPCKSTVSVFHAGCARVVHVLVDVVGAAECMQWWSSRASLPMTRRAKARWVLSVAKPSECVVCVCCPWTVFDFS